MGTCNVMNGLYPSKANLSEQFCTLSDCALRSMSTHVHLSPMLPEHVPMMHQGSHAAGLRTLQQTYPQPTTKRSQQPEQLSLSSNLNRDVHKTWVAGSRASTKVCSTSCICVSAAEGQQTTSV